MMGHRGPINHASQSCGLKHRDATVNQPQSAVNATYVAFVFAGAAVAEGAVRAGLIRDVVSRSQSRVNPVLGTGKSNDTMRNQQ